MVFPSILIFYPFIRCKSWMLKSPPFPINCLTNHPFKRNNNKQLFIVNYVFCSPNDTYISSTKARLKTSKWFCIIFTHLANNVCATSWITLSFFTRCPFNLKPRIWLAISQQTHQRKSAFSPDHRSLKRFKWVWAIH